MLLNVLTTPIPFGIRNGNIWTPGLESLLINLNCDSNLVLFIYLNILGNLELESKANQLCYDKITENFEYDTMPSSKWIVMTMILHCTAIGGRDILPFRK